ncbi:1-acyl-sn-glycerol-3-phosphate acyltransferase [Kribbella sp. VKM Ac-2568]|uniref:lysophospholipid acyltransferase family protein n=1 Tax=Kribbella sp. VKM Ac-2568 TaxID=2512219 RepID=UPI0010EF7284|nr:lysophospholipid acyltransferase family protein [Kribbella sp. VKM Ac-2568]TCM41055.1 1-acyl-sn-glycerol-3-phosphate acyltransferase [Kribbella sp. VKM Ac-2568]
MTDGNDQHQEAAVNGQRTAEGPRPRRGFWFGLVVAIVKPFMLIWTKQDFRGRENVPRTGGMVFVTNHISHFDPFVLGFYIWECRRIPRLLGKASLFKLPIAGRIITSAGQIPVYRDSAEAADAFRAAVAAVEKGECVGVYPEGTITRDPEGWPMTGKTGAARIALMTGCPVIPIANWGAQEVFASYGSLRIRLLPRKTMRVTAGEPVDLSAFEGKPITNQLLHEATEVIMHRVADELGVLRAEAPPKELFDLRKHQAVEQADSDEKAEAEEKDRAAGADSVGDRERAAGTDGAGNREDEETR